MAHDYETALMHALRSLDFASEPRQPLALIAALRLLGELETEKGQYDAAREHLSESLELADACEAPFELALTLLGLAELRAAANVVDEARTLVDEVVAICEPLSAGPTLERARRLRDRLTVPHARLRHPAGLTRREVEVLHLVALGMSDREIAEQVFISHHTVMHHVSNILAKLEVQTRAAAAAKAVRLGLS